MIFEADGVTIIGVKVLQKRLFEKYLKKCESEYEKEISFCEICSGENIVFEIPFKLPEGVGPVTQKQFFEISKKIIIILVIIHIHWKI
jgi:hypothetical protein